jgi:hypothetical protein
MSNTNNNNNSNSFAPVINNSNNFSPTNTVNVNTGGRNGQGFWGVVVVAIVAIFAALIFALAGKGGNDNPQLPVQQPDKSVVSHVHTWKAATCTAPKTCVECGATEGVRQSHTWRAATCTTPKTCVECGATEGTVEHQWVAATYAAPKTCALCGKTEGEKLKAQEVYINELIYKNTDCDHYGKIWTMGTNKPNYTFHTDVTSDEDYKDISTRGHTTGPVYDYWGNQYTYGFHVDGPQMENYYIVLDIDGKYTRFTGICSMTPDVGSETASKYFEVWGDGKRIGTSAVMEKNGGPMEFSFDITGIRELKIVYPAKTAPSRIAAIFDGKLS